MLAKPSDIHLTKDLWQRLWMARNADAGEGDAVARDFLGRGLVPEMKKSPLVERLQRMRREVDSDDDTLERKLRYFLWLN
jgi:hypothetical protein